MCWFTTCPAGPVSEAKQNVGGQISKPMTFHSEWSILVCELVGGAPTLTIAKGNQSAQCAQQPIIFKVIYMFKKKIPYG